MPPAPGSRADAPGVPGTFRREIDVRLTSPSRRAAGLLAASTIGLSTALLSVAGVATAAPAPVTSDDGYSASSDEGDTGITIDDGYCVAWVDVIGGQGGGVLGQPATGGPADQVTFLMPVQGGQTFTFTAGLAGHDGIGLPGTSSGGAASQLLLGSSVVASAKGGADATGGAAGAGTTSVDPVYVVEDTEPFLGSTDDPDNGYGWTEDGLVEVSAIGCDAPYVPSIDGVSAGDESATVAFWPQEGDAYTAAPSGHEYTVDGGNTWAPVEPTGTGDDGRVEFSVPGLVNGTEYAVQIRATSEHNGVSESSDAASVTPFAPVGAPRNVVVTPGPGSFVVSWSAPDVTGTFPVAGYEVYVSDPEAQMGGNACSTEALSCVVAAEPGHTYSVTVVSIDSNGSAGGDARASSGTIPAVTAPTSVPTGSGTVGTGGSTTLAAGTQVTLTGSGYLPGSTVELFVYSTPRSLGSVVAVDGSFTWTGALPADLVDGQHHVVAAGVDPDGNPRYLVTAVTVSGGVAAPNAAPIAGTSSGLAYTGFSPMPFIGVGLVALLAGGGLLVASRRRAR